MKYLIFAFIFLFSINSFAEYKIQFNANSPIVNLPEPTIQEGCYFELGKSEFIYDQASFRYYSSCNFGERCYGNTFTAKFEGVDLTFENSVYSDKKTLNNVGRNVTESHYEDAFFEKDGFSLRAYMGEEKERTPSSWDNASKSNREICIEIL